MNVPLLAVNKAVKLDFFTGQDRDSTGGERKEEEERVVQLTEFMSSSPEVKLHNFPRFDSFYCSNEGSNRKILEG